MKQPLPKTLTLALDAMGGDNAPRSVLAGASLVLKATPHVCFMIFGDEEILVSELSDFPALKDVATVCHTPDVVASDTKPSIALRQGRNSSMRLAINAVKDGVADGMVSAGNTGALMAMAKIVFRTLPGIDRPAIASLFPTQHGQSVLLDLGANIDCSAENLFQFAIMGDAFARTVLGLENPKVALLNVGEEEGKGSEVVKAADVLLRASHLAPNFHGYVEGNDIAEGTVDVVVTDGFTGNVALKMAEGTAKICKIFLKEALTSSWIAKLGAWLALSALKRLSRKIDPRLHNGAMFIGLNGIAVKSHGSADAVAFSNAINVALGLAVHKVNDKITEELALSQLQNGVAIVEGVE